MKKIIAILAMIMLLLGTAVVASAAEPATDGLVVYYSFDDETANNQVGETINGTVDTSVTFVDGVSGKAAAFTGDSSDPHSNIVFNMGSGLQSFTISFWYQIPEIITGDAVPYALLGSSDWNQAAVHCHITDGVVRAAFNGAFVKYSDLNTNPYGKTPGREAEVEYTLTEDLTNKWINFAVTYDWDTKERFFYMNGTLVGHDVANTVGTDAFLKGEIQIGSYRVMPERNFGGMIDEVRIYDRALSVEEVADLVAVAEDAVVIPEPSLKPIVTPTPTPEPTATPDATVAPTQKPTTQATQGSSFTKKPEATTTATQAPESQGGDATIFIIIGAIVVAAAVAGVIIFLKKKKTDAPAE